MPDDPPTQDPAENVLWVWTLSELALLTLLFVLLLGSVLGWNSLFAGYSRQLRLAGVAFLFVELLIPAWVYVDLRRRGIGDSMWMHAAAMPGVNVFGLLAYLGERRRKRASE